MAIQPDGKLVAAGFSTSTTIPDFGVARNESNGHLDRRFGAGGTVVTDFSGSGSADIAYAVAIDSNGKVVVAGYSDASGSSDFALARYNPDGKLDHSDGKIVAAGFSDVSGTSDFDSPVSSINPEKDSRPRAEDERAVCLPSVRRAR